MSALGITVHLPCLPLSDPSLHFLWGPPYGQPFCTILIVTLVAMKIVHVNVFLLW